MSSLAQAKPSNGIKHIWLTVLPLALDVEIPTLKKHKCSRKGTPDWIVVIRVGGVLPIGNAWASEPKTND
jgi:hypothetical protein